MPALLIIFITVQITLLLFMALHDIIPVPPLNDIDTLARDHSLLSRCLNGLINSIFVIIPLALTIYYMPNLPFWAVCTCVVFYGILTVGTVFAWWVPYLFGSSATHKQEFMMFKNTHHFLPARGDNVIPNTLHVLLHLQVWFCLGVAIYFVITLIRL